MDRWEPEATETNATTRRSQSAPTRSVAFQTLGCKLNQYETDALASRLQKAGYRIAGNDERADCHIINTCTVTNRGDRKSRNAINRALRARAPLIVVTGCFAESHRDELERDQRVVAVPNESKQAIDQLVQAHFAGEILRPDELPRGVFDFGVPDPIFHTRNMIKIQDGCDNHCSFCIIPFVRGRARSRPADQIRDELKRSLDSGYREVVLTGVNISRYDDQGTSFSQLVESLLEIDGDFRIRLSSLEPDRLDDRFFDLFAHPRMAPHLHLCLQSGSERILLQMRRQYTAVQYRSIAERLLARFPGFNLTTDCIVGFPGETDAEFEQTCEMVRDIGFSHVHTFPYSVRSGTRAARMREQVPNAVKTQRSAKLREISRANRYAFRSRALGTVDRVLIERFENRTATGYTARYIPVVVRTGASEGLRNRFLDVTLRRLVEEDDEMPVLAEPTTP